MLSYANCLSKTNFNPTDQLVFVDAGCNINDIPPSSGILDDFTGLFLNKYPNAIGYGFEPLYWQKYEEVYKNDSRIKLFKKALSNTNENMTLYTSGVTDVMLCHPTSSLWNRQCYTKGVREDEVECITLDTFMKKEGISYINYLKLDTEGAELPILKGARNAISDHYIDYIQLEHGGTYEDAGYTMQELISFMNFYGYSEIYRTSSELLFTVV